MARRINLLAALAATAELELATVSQVVMTLRFSGFGGNGACRGLLRELEQRGALRLKRPDSDGDRRQKVVQVTERGWEELIRYATDLTMLTARAGRRQSEKASGLSDLSAPSGLR